MFFLFILTTLVFAQDCDVNEYYDQTTSSCATCPSSCETCFSAEKCATCQSGFYMNNDYGCEERSDITNCKTWDNLYCVECSEGYYLKDQTCNSCTSNCNYCNSNGCFQCEDTFTLVSNGKECVDCSLSENDEACGRCSLTQYFNVTSLHCETCKTNCIRCSTYNNCLMCAVGYTLEDSDDLTSNIVELKHCEEGYSFAGKCELCTGGYYLSGGECLSCGQSCDRCINETFCVECSNHYYLTDNKCVSGDIDHCSRKNNVQGCLECSDGYYLSDHSTCLECSSECSTCLNSTYCFRCADDYYFDSEEGVCTQMGDYCKVSDQYGCLECLYDQTNSALCTQKKVDYPSIVCENQTFGYYLPVEEDEEGNIIYQKECELCDVQCKICEYNSSWCTACNDGYSLEEDTEASELYEQIFGESSTIYKCVTKPDECSRTEMGYCVECIDSYFLSGVVCIQCDESCGSCTSSSFCQTCNSEVDNSTGDSLYWRSSSLSSLTDEEKGLCFSVNDTFESAGFDKCLSSITTTGCSSCEAGFYAVNGSCLECPSRCEECKTLSSTVEQTGDGIICTACSNSSYLTSSTNATCNPCSDIEHCEVCSGSGCSQCEDGYSPSLDRLECTKVNLALILPLCFGAGLILILFVIVIIFILWRRRRMAEKKREKEIRPFRVSSDVELALLSADNENFPLKTEHWELDFGLASSKAAVDKYYEQKMNICNTSKKSYYFEILVNPSHKYELEVDPVRQTLKPGYAIEVTFKIKMICTSVVNEDIGIVAMDVDDSVKETAKIKIIMESDLSIKLDHTDLKPNNPPIGEGAFGLVFSGKYRGQDVAIKKMKARNLTEEQEKEFNHEVQMLSQLRHQTVVNLIGAVYTEGEIAIVTEFADYGSFSKMWGKYEVPYDLKIKILDDLAVALQFLHQNNILHRDIKGENVLIYSLNPHSSVCGKLTDFGTCRNVSQRMLDSKELSCGIGTPTYMAPESLQSCSDYSYPVDVYAYGMVLYETFTEKQAYIDDPAFEQPWMIPQFVIEGKRLERPEGMDDGYWNLLNACWAQNAEERPNMDYILDTIASWGYDITYAGGESNGKESLAKQPIGVGDSDKPEMTI
ncbi:Serine-threonine protein kinase [Entamoeba marina]